MKPGQGKGNREPHMGMRWFVEIIQVDGHCSAHLGYSRLPGSIVVWESTTWQLPDMPLSQRLVIEELYDALSVLHEQSES